MAFYVYILASEPNGTLYTGMTDDIAGRVHEHRTKLRPGFTRAYGVVGLVRYEVHDTREDAFVRERQIKKWRRRRKLRMIEALNPTWRDLYDILHFG